MFFLIHTLEGVGRCLRNCHLSASVAWSTWTSPICGRDQTAGALQGFMGQAKSFRNSSDHIWYQFVKSFMIYGPWNESTYPYLVVFIIRWIRTLAEIIVDVSDVICVQVLCSKCSLFFSKISLFRLLWPEPFADWRDRLQPQHHFLWKSSCVARCYRSSTTSHRWGDEQTWVHCVATAKSQKLANLWWSRS